MPQKLEPKAYYEALAKMPSSSGAILWNSAGNILLQKQPYRAEWHIPGGMLDAKETPKQAAQREVKEECGITINKARLFCVDITLTEPYDRIHFLFDCGRLSDEEIGKIVLDPEEVSEIAFFTFDEALKILSPRLARRLVSSRKALETGGVAYLENEKVVSEEF